MMDFVISQQLAKSRYEEMLEDAANERRARAFMPKSTRAGVISQINNLIADLKFRGRNPGRRAATNV